MRPHFGRLIVPTLLTASVERLVVTVSNFAPLVSVALENPGVHDRTEFEALLNERDEHRLSRSLKTTEYVVVPEQLLWSAYDGSAELLRGGSWRVRYFDYL